LYGNIDCALALIDTVKTDPEGTECRINYCSQGINLIDKSGHSALFYAVLAGQYDKPIYKDIDGRVYFLDSFTYSQKFGALKVFNRLVSLGAKFASKAERLLAMIIAAKQGNYELAVKLLGMHSAPGSPAKRLAHLFA